MTSIWVLPVIAAGAGDPRRLPDRLGRALSLAFVAGSTSTGALEAPVIDGGWLGILDVDDPDAGRLARLRRRRCAAKMIERRSESSWPGRSF